MKLSPFSPRIAVGFPKRDNQISATQWADTEDSRITSQRWRLFLTYRYPIAVPPVFISGRHSSVPRLGRELWWAPAQPRTEYPLLFSLSPNSCLACA